MSILTIILLAIGLAMDCFAVSVCKGLTSPHGYVPRYVKPMLMALLFGVFHAGMPLIGYFAGSFFASFFERFAPWIALLLLGFIGGKMIYDSLKGDDNEAHLADFSFFGLLSLAFATSMDTLATGVIFIPHPEVLWLAVGVIAATCFLFSMIGFILGHLVGARLRVNVTILGGIILILIGLKIFLEGIL
ncbi:MAG: manganese efflux pump [Paludibacteraceae bacterium]|nr:manganese efflux pump [Paludibacteraceae bacterium]